jgi:hypothetical protein
MFDAIVESSTPVLDPVSPPIVGGIKEPDIVTWPYPRIITSAYHTFLLIEDNFGRIVLGEVVVNIEGVWSWVAGVIIGPISEIDNVEIVDFGHYYVVLVTGVTIRNFAKLLGQAPVELISPVFGTGCNNKGQFIGGNISNWQNLGRDGIAWSSIGIYEFDPERDQTSGFRTLVSGKVPGNRVTIYKIIPFTSGGIIVYTDLGQVFLTNNLVGSTFVYGLGELEGVGVSSGREVAGNIHTQMFVNLNNELCKYQRTTEMHILGYKRQIEELRSSNTPLIMNFLEDRNTFFLSNGVSTLVVNDYGAGMVHQAISGIVKGWNKHIYGTFRDFEDMESRITLDALSLDSRGKKTLEWIISDISYSPDTHVTSSSYWRNGASDLWRTYHWRNGSPSGEFFIGLSAVEYRPALKFSNYVHSECYSFKVTVKYPDARTRRGIAAISGAQRDANSETTS